jgi:hypothetical protein
LTPAPAGNANASTHRATSDVAVRAVATSQKRRFLRQIGLRQADLEGIGLALLDSWARAQAKVELLDEHFVECGLLDDAGEPRPATRIYFTALNSARLALVRLQEHLRDRSDADPFAHYVIEADAAEVEEDEHGS